MIQRLDCSKCGINQVDVEGQFIALPMAFICRNCYKKQRSLEEIIQELEAEIEKLKGHWDEAERRIILSESQNYCKICGNTLDGYIPPRE